jgi:oxygen-independent coproporphyrinogen-3 oxidase
MRENEDIDAEHFHLAHDLLMNAGFDHYETSNYAQAGHESSHNLGYWQGENYLGLGPSAVTTIGHTRSKNIADTARYIEQVGTLGHALGEAEHIDPESRRIERIALGLRTSKGIPLSLLDPAAHSRASNLASEGLARIDQNTLILVGRGRALVDPIAAELI